MPTTDWTLEKKPGEAWAYNESELTYNEDRFDGGLSVTYNALGASTQWTLEDQ